MNRSLYIGVAIALLTAVLAFSSLIFSGQPRATGSAVKLSQDIAVEQMEATDENSPPAELVEDLKSVLSMKTGVPSYEILFISAEATNWPDACLGAADADEVCAQVITPGYRVILSTLTEEFTFHTDRLGENLRLLEDD
ncbi:MAG: hypothetical protein Kow00121_58140 [Elainellaceae cyanobacterium]